MAVKKKKIVIAKAKRKTAIARARIKEGSGHIRINSKLISTISSEFVKNEITMPLLIAEGVLGKGFANGLDIKVNVHGGGVMGQAEATKAAIAKALVYWTESDELKNAYLKEDRHLLVDDVRRKEPKKPLGRGARKKRQKSYR